MKKLILFAFLFTALVNYAQQSYVPTSDSGLLYQNDWDANKFLRTKGKIGHGEWHLIDPKKFGADILKPANYVAYSNYGIAVLDADGNFKGVTGGSAFITTLLGYTPASSYTAGTGINISSNTISVNSTVLQGSYGQATVSGTILQTNYTINHGFSFTPSKIVIQPRSANAAALSYVTNITATQFTIVFLSVPVIGTNNITFDYIGFK